MNAYELADEYGTYAESHDWGKQAKDMLRQQADRIAELEKQLNAPKTYVFDGRQVWDTTPQTNAEPVAWAYYDDWHKLKLSQTMPHEDGSFPLYTTPQTKYEAPPLSDSISHIDYQKTHEGFSTIIDKTTPQTNAEPVAWINDENIVAVGKCPKDFIHSWKPLYTTPHHVSDVKQTNPLSDEEIEQCFADSCTDFKLIENGKTKGVVNIIDVGRAIEAKIRGEK